MTPTLSFFVPGRPSTAGSKRAIPLRRKDGSWVKRPSGAPVVVVVDDSGEEGKAWRSCVRDSALAAFGDFRKLLEGPLSVVFTFHRIRPQGHLDRFARVKASAAPYPITRPDLLKLARAAEDALTSVVWRDDSQIVTELLLKRWSEREGVQIDIFSDPQGAALVPAAKQLGLALP